MTLGWGGEQSVVWHGFLNDVEIACLKDGLTLEEVLAGLDVTDEVRVLCAEALENHRVNEECLRGRSRGRRGGLMNVIAQRVRRWELEKTRRVE